MKGLVVSFIVGIIALSLVGFGQLSGSQSDHNKDWGNNFWSKAKDWGKSFWGKNDDWNRSFSKHFDFKKFIGFLNSGDVKDKYDEHNDKEKYDQSPIDNAKVSFTIFPREIHTEDKDYFQNVVNECIFSSTDSFEPLCVRCKIMDMNGDVIAKGEVIDMEDSYTAPEQIPIPLSSVPPVEDNEPAFNIVQEMSNVWLSVCGEKCVPVFADFTELEHGAQEPEINTVMSSKGISVSGVGNNGIDKVIIFDADKSNTADPDLEVDHGFHLLILPETTSQPDDPNDAAAGGTIIVKSDTPFFLKSFILVDLENNKHSSAKVYATKEGGNPIKTIDPLPITGDGKFTTVFVNAPNAKRLEVTTKDSFGITNIDLKCEPPKGGKGCTPGFWKQKQHFQFWTDYDQDDKFANVFDIEGSDRNLTVKVDNKNIKLKDLKLLDALKAQGGGLNALARHGVAALLNAASTNYAFTVDEVKSMVKEAIENESYESTKNILEKENEKGCPFKEDKCDCDDHKKQHDTYYTAHKKYYDDHKNKFKRSDYKKFMNDHKKYLNDNGKNMVKSDYKKHIDYFKDFLDDNKRKFTYSDYKKYNNDYKKFSNDYKHHDNKCKCDDDRDKKDDDHDRKGDDHNGKNDDHDYTKVSTNECKGLSDLELKYRGSYSKVTMKVYNDDALYAKFSRVSNEQKISLPIGYDKINDSLVFKIYKGNSLKDQIKVDATCSDIKDVGEYYKGRNGYKLYVNDLEKILNS